MLPGACRGLPATSEHLDRGIAATDKAVSFRFNIPDDRLQLIGHGRKPMPLPRRADKQETDTPPKETHQQLNGSHDQTTPNEVSPRGETEAIEFSKTQTGGA